MIFELFLTFSILSCIFIFLGYYVKPEIKVLAVLGFATLFFMGLILQSGHVTKNIGYREINHPACAECGGDRLPLFYNRTVEYNNWTIVSYNVTDNRSGNVTWFNTSVNYPYNVTTTEFIGYQNVNGSGNFTYIASTEVIKEYDAINDSISKWIGRWISIVSVMGAILVFTSNRQKEDDD